MIDLLSSLVNTITSVIGYFISTIESFLTILGRIPAFINYISQAVSLLPGIFIPFILATLSITVILFIIGRN